MILITFLGFLQRDGAVRQFSADFGAEKQVFDARFGGAVCCGAVGLTPPQTKRARQKSAEPQFRRT
jgi:hypothetical protein